MNPTFVYHLRSKEAITTEVAITDYIRSRPDSYHPGGIESLEARVEALIEFVGVLTKHLTPEQQVAVVEEFTCMMAAETP